MRAGNLTLHTLLHVKVMVDSGEIQSSSHLARSGICKLSYDTLTSFSADKYQRHDVACDLDTLFSYWPERSYNEIYPVPSDIQGEYPGAAFMRINLWIGEYGAARIRLLDWYIQQLKEQGYEPR